MGQVALGFRSLAIKGAVFFVMASLLAWALGGELLPRPQSIDETRVQVSGVEIWWQMTTRRSGRPLIRYELVRKNEGGPKKLVGGQDYSLVAGPQSVLNLDSASKKLLDSGLILIWGGQREFSTCCFWEYFGINNKGEVVAISESLISDVKQVLFNN
tara:strand:+ start:397 stop:867 length:471 start_codon:yes stop_codon:yes gene_type:complete